MGKHVTTFTTSDIKFDQRKTSSLAQKTASFFSFSAAAYESFLSFCICTLILFDITGAAAVAVAESILLMSIYERFFSDAAILFTF